VSTTEQPRQGVTLLQFRRVVPSSAWLRASILWADGLAAVWPMREPTPLNHAQEQPLQEVWSLLNVGLFERKYIYDLFFTTAEAGEIAQILDDATSAHASALHGAAWEDGGLAAGPQPVTVGRRPTEYDPDTYIYPDKLPSAVTQELAGRNLIERRPDGRGYTVTSIETLNQLLAAYARVLQEISDNCLPDVEEPDQARRIAAPSNTEETRQALVLTLRGAVQPDLQTDFQRFIEFRTADKNERARRDYIEQLTSLWELCARGGPEHAREQVISRVVADLRKARESYFTRIDRQMLAAQALSSFGVVLPLAPAHPAAAVAGAIATVGASVVTVTVRNNAPRYIRRATQSNLLAPMAI
jgi:hypothetical protein